ncbi:MAG: lytic transglycosylase domain-containing protein, partial [Desulforhopalus sp.]
RIGPLLGIDISREGFYRMAHMLGEQPLDETGAVNDKLREVLGLGERLEPPPADIPQGEITPRDAAPLGETESGSFPLGEGEADQVRQPSEPDPLPPGPEVELLNDTDAQEGEWFDWRQLFGLREAHAATSPQLDIVISWTVEMVPAEQVLAKMRKVFTKTAKGLEKKLDDIVGEKGWGQWMIEATAWQESCFRQFVVKDEKITYLLSYNNTSVGVMQVNEKVWRGIYDIQELRWNTEYNILAGSEILALYLNRYLAGHKDFSHHSATSANHYLAGWLYSLYNGGPGQLKKFSRRSGSGKPSRLDLSFKEKFDLVRGGDWLTKVECLSHG